MDTSRPADTPGPASSRLPTKKNSLHSLHDVKENLNTSQRLFAMSPTAFSDTSSVSDMAGLNPAAVNGNRNGATSPYGFGFGSRRSSTSSQPSDLRGRTSTGRPGQTRIPRPSPGAPASRPASAMAGTITPGVASNRRSISIKDAFKMAEDEEAAAVAAAAQGSPSPAPRPWRSRAGGGGVKSTPTPGTSAAAAARTTPTSATESRMQKILSNFPLDIGGRRTARRIGELPAQTTDDQTVNQSAHQTAHDRTLGEDNAQSLNSRSERNGGAPDIRRIRYEEDQARLMVAMGERSGGLFSPKTRVSPKIAVAGRELHRRASNSSLNERSRVPVSTSATSPRPSLTTTRSLLSSTASSRARAGSIIKRTLTAPSPENASQKPPRTRSSLSGRASVSGTATRRSIGAVSEANSNSDDLESVASPPPTSPVPTSPVPTSATAPVLLPADGAEPPLISSPGKSFAWNTDDDFTSDSLMVSESPPLHTRPDPSVSYTPAGNPPLKSPDLRSRNTKLDEIRQLEIEASIQFPDDASSGERNTNNGEAVSAEKNVEEYDRSDESVQPIRRLSLPAERQNKAIDEIRARENEGMSKRAISAAKLDEIRQRNAEFRTTSLDTSRTVSFELARDEQPQELEQKEKDEVVARVRAQPVFEEDDDEHMANTPSTVARTDSRGRGRKLQDANDSNSTTSRDKDRARSKSIVPALLRKSSSATHSRTESQELLRKLARVTTSVVAAERKDKSPPSPRRLRLWFSSESLRTGEEIKPLIIPEREVGGVLRLPRLREPDTLRPTVGFAQLRRASTDSVTTKRSSAIQSDGDPIDRIEAEMKLFAAHGDQSERGSIRALSPDTDGNASGSKGVQAADDATPKAAKIVNPLLQATPRVTGAYVETPMTVRTENMVPDEPAAEPVTEPATSDASKPTTGSLLSLLRSATGSNKADKPETEPAEKAEPEGKADGSTENGNTNGNSTGNNGVAAHTRQRSLSGRRSRSRSRSRSTSHPRAPLKNSAKPASARDDLLAIQRDQRIDDSTLDDFDTVLAKHTPDEDTDASGATDAPAKATGGTSDSDRLRRMSQSINTYIMDVQTAKKGIERLEDRVSHPEKATAEIMATAISGSMEDFDKEITAALNRHEAERQSLLANIKKEEMDVSDVDSIPPVPVVTKRKTHQRQSSSVASVAKAAKEVQETNEEKEAEAGKIAVPTITITAPSVDTPAVNANVPVVSYLQIPVPKLYRSDARGSRNKKRLTFFGILVLLLAVWFAVETTTCALYCRPETCQSGQSCRWSPDDPSFGHAVPVKVDQWLTGGKGRTLMAWASEEMGDLLADIYDAATGTDIQQVDPTYFSFEEKRRHRRRLQKRGLVQPWTPSPETRSKIAAWRRAREAREQEAAAAAAVRQQRTARVHEGEEYDIFGDAHYTEAVGSDDKGHRWW